MQNLLAATQTAGRTENRRPSGLIHTTRLVGGRDHCRSGAGCHTLPEICFLKNHRPLKNHFYLTPRLYVYVSTTREERYQPNRGQSCSDSAETAGYRVTRPQPSH